MPLEIKELIIKATVQDENATSNNEGGVDISEDAREEFIAECVDRVLEILESEKQR